MRILTRLWRYGALPLALVLALAPQAAPGQGVLQKLVAPHEVEATTEPAATETDPAALTAEQTRLLIDLLRDAAAREALIGELERLAADRAAATPDTAAEPAAAESPAERAESGAAAVEPGTADQTLSFGRRIAQQTQAIAEGMAAQAVAFWKQVSEAPAAFDGLARVQTDFLIEALLELALVILTTVGIFVSLRFFARRLYRWMGARARPMGFFGTATVYLASVAIDALIVLVAWAAGYVLALTAVGEFGHIAIRQTLYLNAFLIVEMVKVGIRAVLSPSTPDLRPVRVSNRGARLTYRTLDVVVSIIGYGQFLVVPIVAQNVGYYSSRSVSALLLLVALVILAVVVFRSRRAVAEWLCNGREGRVRSRFWRGVARVWYIPVLLYIVAVFLIVVTRPGDVLMPVLAASGKILAAAVIGWALAGMLGRAIARGIRLPASVNRRLPLLERRLNALVPRILFVLRLVILVVVVGYTIHVIGLFDLNGWLAGPLGVWLTTTAGAVAVILLLSAAIWLALTSWVDYRLNPDFGTVPTSRERTLLTLLRNAATIGLIVLTLMFVLSEIGIDIAPLIASAGIIGLAVGFGAQKMVQDIITGIFIQLENAINVGDVVTAGGTSGVVERLTIRSVSLRDVNGVFHIIPFSSVDMVSNFMREFAFAVIDMGVGYRVDVEVAKQAMHDAFEELRADPEFAAKIIGDLDWNGIMQFADSAVILRARIKTLPGQQWGIGRAYNGIIKRVFDERGIEIPFPTRTLYVGEGSQGMARVAVASAPLAEAQAGEPPAKGEPGGTPPAQGG